MGKKDRLLLSDRLPAAAPARLTSAFFVREDVVAISRELLGKVLATCFDGQRSAGIIVETEAYRGPDDRACHAWMNRRTRRTEVMFARGGRAYVYLCYGIHHLFNIVTGRQDMPHAVLIRALEPLDNVSLMLERRGLDKPERRLTAGPGTLSQALGIHTRHSGTLLTAPDSPIWLEDRGIRLQERHMLASPRVGIPYGGESRDWPWRFRVAGSPWTSRA